MLMSWLKRTARLGALLNTQGNDEEDGLALDRLLHGQSVIGQTCESYYSNRHFHQRLTFAHVKRGQRRLTRSVSPIEICR